MIRKWSDKQSAALLGKWFTKAMAIRAEMDASQTATDPLDIFRKKIEKR